MKRAALALMLSALTLLPSCGDEETPLAPYREDILDVYTDADGFASQLLRDDGTRLTVANRVGGLPADTSYRVMALYTEEGGNAHLTSLAQVLAPLPAAYLHGASMADPVDVEAVWSGGGYINLRLALKTGGLPHTFGFDDRGITTGAGKSRMLHLTLLHDQGIDPLYYTRTTYVACPLYPYAADLTAGRDSITLTVPTDDGERAWKFAFPVTHRPGSGS